jgi:hypothetical protein
LYFRVYFKQIWYVIHYIALSALSF